MFRCRNLKYSLILIFNSFSRQFHTSPKIYLRRVSPKITPSFTEPESLKNDLNQKLPENSNTDFLGIESDEGVITLPPPQNLLTQSLNETKPKEKFHRTSFGVIRYDSDNKLKFHAQYQKISDFTFPYGNTEITEVSKHLQKLPYRSKSAESDCTKEMGEIVDSHLLENVQDESYIDECYFSSTSDREIVSNIEETNKNCESYFSEKNDQVKSYIDEHYFGNISEKNIKKYNDNENHPSSEKLNFIDEHYFATLENCTSKKETNKISEVTSQLTSHDDINESNNHKNDVIHPFSRQLSSLNENSASEKERNKIFVEGKQPASDNIIESDLQKLNYFDECYFEKCTEFESTKPLTSPSIESFNAKITSDYNKSKLSKLNTIENSYTNLKSDAIGDESECFHSDTSVLSSNHTIPKFSDGNTSNVTSTMKIGEQNKKFNKDDGNKWKKSFQEDFEISSSLGLSDAKLASNQEGSLSENYNDSEFSVDNSIGRKKDLNQLSNVSENPDTSTASAYDFVKKLRKEQVDTSVPNTKKGLKFDSKGFRILTNQVDNLSYFTRDEILSLLKDNIVYSDDDLLILNKPYGLVIHDSKTTKHPCLSTFLDDLAKELDKEASDPKLFTVHRLDKETTGCLLLARNEIMSQHLKSLFVQRKIVKKYWVVTIRVPDPLEGVIDMPISEGKVQDRQRMVLHPKLPKDLPYRSHSKHGKEAITSYKVIKESGNAALVEVFPKTGIKHQIRVHFGFGLSCPILGDHKYSHLDKLAPQKLPTDILQRLHVRQSKVRHVPMHIHAKSVVIPDYFVGRPLIVNIPLPKHMIQNLKSLKFRK